LSAAGGDPNAAIARMPAETRAYVPKVMARVNPALMVGQSPGEKAAQEAQAKANVDLSMSPRIEAAKTAA
jgi:hypothetical protein